ncbi:MAG: hypothetical protein H7A46_08640 [Verrucomicrobiales bacterium]|nr:hypothetical protein [Verrucomicrobiales bacterium]
MIAAHGAHVDLSGLEEVTGPRTDTYSNDDWLTFYLRTGGTLDLSALRRISRKAWFLPEAGEPLHLPALEEVDGGLFTLLSALCSIRPCCGRFGGHARRVGRSGFCGGDERAGAG